MPGVFQNEAQDRVCSGDGDSVAAKMNEMFPSIELESKCGTWMEVKLPLFTVALWDLALEYLRRVEEARIHESEFIDCMIAEYMSSSLHRGFNPEDGTIRRSSRKSIRNDELIEGMKLYPAEEGSEKSYWREIEESLAESSRYWSFLPWSPVTVEVSENLKPDPSWFSSPFLMAEKLKEMRKLKQEIVYHQGMLFLHMRNHNLQQELMFLRIEHYAIERTGLSSATVRTRIRMAENFKKSPMLEEEFLDENLTQEKVRLLGMVFEQDMGWEREWMKYAKPVAARRLYKTVEKFLRLAELSDEDCRRLSPLEIHETTDDAVLQMGLPGDRRRKGGSSDNVQMCAEQTERAAAEMCAEEILSTDSQICAEETEEGSP